MSNPKVGVIVTRAGIASVALLAETRSGRDESLKLYGIIREAVEAFDSAIQQLAGSKSIC